MQRNEIESNSEYQKLLARANKDNIIVKIRVADKAGKLLGFKVAGKYGDTYTVTVDGDRLVCDCYEGAVKHVRCKHTAKCAQHEMQRADARKVAAQPAADAALNEDRLVTYLPTQAYQGVQLYRH